MVVEFLIFIGAILLLLVKLEKVKFLKKFFMHNDTPCRRRKVVSMSLVEN